MTVETDLKNRLFSTYKNAPNIYKFLECLALGMQDCKNVCEYILDHSSIDTAEGILLDGLGSRIGVYRPKKQENPANLFTYRRLGEVSDPDKGFKDETDPTVITGGYQPSYEGIDSITEAGERMSDADYRKLIRQKAWTFRKKATLENIYNYLIKFGAHCKIDDDTEFTIWVDLARYSDFNHWTRNYIKTRGFKPGGISIRVKDQLRHEASI